ncbi:MAG: hypothetical protein ACRELG_08240, partial [Gemmataceae bacterium]
NGNTFIVLSSGRMLEVDRRGKEIYRVNLSDVVSARRSRQGAIVCLMKNNRCLKVDISGKELQSFAVKYSIENGGFLDLLRNGRLLITSRSTNKVMEYDSQGHLLHEWDVPGVHTATGLPNGHLLVASTSQLRVFEMDRAGKVLWEYRNVKAWRARGR